MATFYIAVSSKFARNSGFIAAFDLNSGIGWIQYTTDIRCAYGFSSFEEADNTARELGCKCFAILSSGV